MLTDEEIGKDIPSNAVYLSRSYPNRSINQVFSNRNQCLQKLILKHGRCPNHCKPLQQRELNDKNEWVSCYNITKNRMKHRCNDHNCNFSRSRGYTTWQQGERAEQNCNKSGEARWGILGASWTRNSGHAITCSRSSEGARGDEVAWKASVLYFGESRRNLNSNSRFMVPENR